MSRFARKSKRALLQREAANKLQRRVERNVGKERKVVTLQGARGGVKMSEVLKSFVEPYMRFTTDLKSAKRLHQTALIAWNTALFPKPERQRQLEQLIAALKLDAHSIADMKAIVAELVERKDRFFAQYKRAILDFELTEAGKDYHLSVVSSAEPVEPAA